MAAELKRRWKLAVAAKGRVAKKSSDPPPLWSTLRKRVLPPPPQAPLPSSSASSESEFIRNGAYVVVHQTPIQISPEQRVVFVHRAVVASAADDGFVEVFFPEIPPRGVQCFEIVRVATHQIKRLVPPPSPSSSTSTGSEFIRIGAHVGVHQPPIQLSTGKRCVSVHGAVVVSAAEDGFVEVFYHETVPRHVQPFRIARVATDQIKEDS